MNWLPKVRLCWPFQSMARLPLKSKTELRTCGERRLSRHGSDGSAAEVSDAERLKEVRSPISCARLISVVVAPMRPLWVSDQWLRSLLR